MWLIHMPPLFYQTVAALTHWVLGYAVAACFKISSIKSTGARPGLSYACPAMRTMMCTLTSLWPDDRCR